MAYRHDTEAARERRDALRRELSELERGIDGRRELARRRAELLREIDDAAREIERARARVSLPMLASVRIASPCHARWDDMKGDERARHCGQCDKTVFDLSAITAAEAETLLREHGASMCARFYRRADGTVMTSDCGVGAARARRRGWALAAGVSVLVGVGITGGLALTIGTGGDERCVLVDDDGGSEQVMGEVAVMGAVVADPGWRDPRAHDAPPENVPEGAAQPPDGDPAQ